ncbi:hypothetical protein [Aquimarina litoralis]|uniref:hypothetical protein n=1 Tax=Aquimarina litoralis TaxID=584605 RepID=UPI001C56A992|nr:hypothetical protein [Aquimarina litoralis]MBW1296378.1 hypothetical protein [Aquimarina litoralis]
MFIAVKRSIQWLFYIYEDAMLAERIPRLREATSAHPPEADRKKPKSKVTFCPATTHILNVTIHMKKKLFLTLFIAISSALFAQNFSLGNFPSENNNDKPIMTSDLLESLNWNYIKDFCSKNEGHFARESPEYKNDLLKRYNYTQLHYTAEFEIISHKGKVLEYTSQISNSPKETRNSYFDKNVWLEYVHNLLPNLEDSLKLNTDESKNILKAYYGLIGADSRDEYGWICEYSAMGGFTKRRRGVIQLLKENRADLLKPLIKNPNLEISMYAIDAMVYQDYKSQQIIINDIVPLLTKLTRELDSLKSNNFSSQKLITNPKEIGYLKKKLDKLRKETLSSDEWQYICELRESNQKVRTCRDGTGSFKIYEGRTADILSETSILDIIEKYKEWKKIGYLD